LRKQLTSSSEIYSKAIADLQHKANLAENFNIQLIRDIERLSADELFFKNIELSDSLKNEQFEREVAIEARDDALRGLCDRDRHIEYCHRLLRRHGITFNPVVGHQVDVRRAA